MNISTLLKNKTFKKYLGNTSWLLSEKILRIFLNLSITMLLARYLGPENFGLLSYSQSYIILFTAFATLGLDQIVTRDIVQNRKNINQLLGTCFILKLIAGLIAIATVYISSGIFEQDNITRWMIVAISFTALFQSSSTIIIYFQSIVKSKNIAIAQSMAIICTSIIKLWLLYNSYSLIWFAIALAIEQLLTFLFLFTVYIRHGKSPTSWRYNNAIATELLKESWPLIFSTIIIVLYSRIDQIMLKHMINETAVGLYSAAIQLSEATSFLPAIIITSLFPAIAKSKEKGNEIYQRSLQHFFDLICFIGFSIAIFFTFFSETLINIFFGPAYHEASQVLIIHIWGMLFSFLGVSCTQWLVLEKKQKYRMYRTLLGVSVNILLNILLIPLYGIIGAAIATMVAQIIASYMGNLLSKKTWEIFFIQCRSFLFFKHLITIYKLIR